jgi:hypothetical protein
MNIDRKGVPLPELPDALLQEGLLKNRKNGGSNQLLKLAIFATTTIK